MVHRISEPPANVWKGKFKEHYEHDKAIKRMVGGAYKMIAKIKLD